jgi:formylglycine-generating enzyme required for sulfatase activity
MKKAIKAFLALFFLILTVSGALAAETTNKPEMKTLKNSIGMTFVYIKPGTFMMGSPASETGRDNDETQHQVTLTRGFYIGETEVTVGQWRTFARDAGYRTEAETGGGAKTCIEGKWEKKEGTYWDNPGFAQSDNHPVTCVSWNDAQEFIRRLNQKEGGSRYRLPTEAEWEYAARSGDRQEQYAGTDNESNLGDYAWYEGNSGSKTHSVGQKRPNGLGLYDMSGNVWEWVQDWKGDYPSDSVTDPAGPLSGLRRVSRGGGWLRDAGLCRSADRNDSTPDYRVSLIGFRLSRTK